MTDVSRALQPPWPNLAVQREGVHFGIWVFLASEILFFSGLFVTYAIYRSFNPQAFAEAGRHAEIFYGTLNTGLLLTSSMTMAVALRASKARLRGMTLAALALTVLLGFGFLLCKGLEYHDDISKNLFPGPHFAIASPPAQLFWMLYWIMTGIHAVHLTAGVLIVLTVVVLLNWEIAPIQGSTIEGLSIYWHFVDCVWIVLFPLLYLIGR